MSTAPPAARAKIETKIETPPAWKWLMRVTGTFAMLLFLTPTFYVVKYYAVDRRNEQKLLADVSAPTSGFHYTSVHSAVGFTADELPSLTWIAQNNRDQGTQRDAIKAVESVLLQPGIGWKRPLECLSAKARLAEIATKASDPNVRQAASEALGKVAQGGAVIRR